MKATILIVEDEPDIQLFARLYLEMAGFRVVQASSGEDALNLMPIERPDVVLLDLRMPGMGGWGFLDRLSAEGGATVPVVVMSAHGDPSTISQALSRGASAYITKPFLPSELVQALEEALGTGGGSQAEEPGPEGP